MQFHMKLWIFVCGLPPHTAERLCLSGDGLLRPFPEAEPQEKNGGVGAAGKAEPYRKVRRQAAGVD